MEFSRSVMFKAMHCGIVVKILHQKLAFLFEVELKYLTVYLDYMDVVVFHMPTSPVFIINC